MDPIRNEVTDPVVLRMLRCDAKLRDLGSDVTAEVIGSFFYIASHDGCHKQALEQELGLSTAAASRITDWLSQRRSPSKQGLDLITKELDPVGRRRVILKLTPKGQSIINQLKSLLYE